MNAKVSVIIPVYKVEDYLHRCVDSIINQTLKELEIILVDDGSPDDCPSICDEYALKDERIKVVHKPNGGLSSARNVGLKIATGEYIFFVDSDDWLDLDGLELLYKTAIEQQVDFVRYRAIRTGWPGLPENAPCMLGEHREILGGYYSKDRIKEELYPKLFVSKQLTLSPILGAWGSLYNREFLQSNNLYFYDEIRFSEDMIFSANVVYKAKNFYYIDNACVYHYFYNPNSISKSFRKDRWESCKQLIKYFYRDFENLKDYDFKPQLERLKWFCILLGLNERKYLNDSKIRQNYCKEIIDDKIVKDTKLKLSNFDISWKEKLTMLSIKIKTLNFLIWR